MKIVNLFDVKSNLHKNTHEPYRKSEKQSVKVCHQQKIIENIVQKETFEKAIPPYNEALKLESKCTWYIWVKPKTKKCKMKWFNPPYSVNEKNKHR